MTTLPKDLAAHEIGPGLAGALLVGVAAAKALARIEEIVGARVAALPAWATGTELVVQHVDAADRAHELAGRLQERLPQVGSVSVVDLAAVVAVHGGPGTIGVAVCPHGPGHGAPRAH